MESDPNINFSNNGNGELQKIIIYFVLKKLLNTTIIVNISRKSHALLFLLKLHNKKKIKVTIIIKKTYAFNSVLKKIFFLIKYVGNKRKIVKA